MQDVFSQLAALRRPRLLMRAARFAAEHYRRDVCLAPLLGVPVPPRHGDALMRLMDIETSLNAARFDGTGTYTAERHIDVLASLIGESRLIRAARAPQTKASGMEAFLPST